MNRRVDPDQPTGAEESSAVLPGLSAGTGSLREEGVAGSTRGDFVRVPLTKFA